MPRALANDVMESILFCLPSKALSEIRWTCKQWLALTSDPSFVRRYYALHPFPPMAGLFINGCPDIAFVPLPGCSETSSISIPIPPMSKEVVASCNGLILLRCGDDDDDRILYVCNPTTGTVQVIPKRPAAKYPHLVSYDLAFNLITREFIIFSIDTYHTPTLFHTYSSASREWSQSAAVFGTRGVYLNGSMYWINSKGCSMRVLHIAQDRMSSIPLPHLSRKRKRINDFSASHGRLHLLVLDEFDYNNMPFTVWEMNPDSSSSSSWTLLYRVKSMFTDDPLYSKLDMTPWMFIREENQDMLLINNFCGLFLFYNFADRTFKEIQTPDFTYSLHIFRYLPF